MKRQSRQRPENTTGKLGGSGGILETSTLRTKAKMDYVLSEHAKTAMTTREIKAEWLEITLNHPELSQPHEDDPTLHYAFRRIPDYGNRVLRVIYNKDRNPVTIVTMYFDRTMKDKL